MSQVLTVSCKLEVLPQQVEKLDAVLSAFAKCCEYVNSHTPEKLTNQIAVQSLIYKEARAHSGLSAQMTIHAIRRVCANRKTAKQKGKPVKGFAPTSATYDSRTFTFRESDWVVSLTMLKGREKFKLHIGNYQKHLLAGQNPKSATLAKRFDGSFYLQIQLESAPPAIPETEDVLGVDLGRSDIAVPSEGEKFSGKEITQVRDRYSRVRASLQRQASKGTRSSRRRCRQVLKRLSGSERRFQAWLNHTSKTCHGCKVIGNRHGKKFECLNLACGWMGDADVNGAKNIAALGMLVNHPGGSEIMSCFLQDVVLRAAESPRCTAIAVSVG